MTGETLVAVYASRTEAEQVRDRLRGAGVPEDDIRLSVDTDNDGRFAPAGAETGTAGSPLASREGGGFFDWLFGSSVPDTDRTWYSSNLREGRTAVSVHLADGAERERIMAILEEFGPIEFEDENATAGVTTASGPAAQEGEQVVPLVKEELEVGKRPVERRHRIRTYVVERPVAEEVTLRDERVVIERRPVAGEASTGAEGMQEREFEVVERHEEPVVAKTAQATEEVAVHKEATEHTETVRDTVRETKVDVDKKAAGDKPSTEKPSTDNPTGR